MSYRRTVYQRYGKLNELNRNFPWNNQLEMDDQRILITLDDCSSLAMADKWVEKYEQFKEFMAEHKSYQLLNASLKNWMHEQRFQYRLSSFGEPSTITAHQISLLNEINFPWEMDPPETVGKDKQ
jgi:Helicase associated domain